MKKVGQNNADKDLALTNRMKAWEMRSRGYTQNTIAEKLDVTQACISMYLKEARIEYHKLYLKKIKQICDEQIAFHEKVAEEAMMAWFESKTSFSGEGKRTPQKVIKKGRPGRNGNESEQINEFKEQYGDPKYLQTAMMAKEKIRKIRGLDAPIKIKDESRQLENISVERTVELLSELLNAGESGEATTIDTATSGCEESLVAVPGTSD